MLPLGSILSRHGVGLFPSICRWHSNVLAFEVWWQACFKANIGLSGRTETLAF